MEYTHYLDAIALATDEVIVPAYMSLLHLIPFLLTSKQLRNKINARSCIAEYIKATIGIPIDQVRPPIKVLTFFQIRSRSKDVPRNINSYYGLAMKDACIVCLNHPYRTVRSYSQGIDHELLFTNGIDNAEEACKSEPSWSVRREGCTNLLRGTYQLVCAKCLKCA